MAKVHLIIWAQVRAILKRDVTKGVIRYLASLIVVVVMLGLLLNSPFWMQGIAMHFCFKSQPVKLNEGASVEISKLKARFERENRTMEQQLLRPTPRSPYLIINASANTYWLKSGSKTIREGVCSTGSYIMLKATEGQQWVFTTPKGLFRIQGKITSPLWVKPDWAFVEQGLPVPAPYAEERYEYGVLGDYALSLGKGYLIHGTLYQRYLGRPVTHGCVRLGDDDLRAVYFALDIGSKVYIY